MTRRILVGALVALALGMGTVGTAAASDGPLSVFPGANQPPPRNDNFANATVLNPNPTVFGPALTQGVIRNATAERGEPFVPNTSFVGASHSVWFSWRAPRTGVVEFNTCHSRFDTTLGIYTGNTVSGLTVVGQNDDAGGAVTSNVTPPATSPGPFPYCGSTYPYEFASQLRFNATAGITYRIAVDGFFAAGFDDTGVFALNYFYPPNVYFP